jgi:hypothetical protein
LCNKQCRDENGFKCHSESESHKRQLSLFASRPGRFLDQFSHEFEKTFLDELKRRYVLEEEREKERKERRDERKMREKRR